MVHTDKVIITGKPIIWSRLLVSESEKQKKAPDRIPQCHEGRKFMKPHIDKERPAEPC